ncbi:5'-methylthioadenosine/adenosylhomocysteine nucleosidase [Acetanaerobacterium elongatum]|uniref:adenosylhomocysteine nucleosidase n=1 Tax=Acetanaerobacterium elongatum TaxID=258515 RepID=A0A1H0BSR7_9FIRM|nr:5'-methylthioadenosine/adenosylhomocysteine nucleosidase [Acetanaerobacterium elongatum]SDN48692.1 adenosylhomocysteine nucleosidase [Acetanaerobacterium elongatum]
MKRIGIIGAMESEVELLKSTLSGCDTREIAHTAFYIGTHGSHELVVACSGIGKVNAACTAQIMIDRLGVDCIINTGIAGGLSDELSVGDVVISSVLSYHDFTLKFLTYRYPFTESFTADNTLIETATDACEHIGNIRYVVKEIVSGDAFVTDSKLKNDIKSRTEAYCVEMEGAAIAHTCAMNDIPFVVIRTISDNADDNAAFSFEQFEKKTAAISAKIVLAMAEHIQ